MSALMVPVPVGLTNPSLAELSDRSQRVQARAARASQRVNPCQTWNVVVARVATQRKAECIAAYQDRLLL
jgi:hypothetical protein